MNRRSGKFWLACAVVALALSGCVATAPRDAGLAPAPVAVGNAAAGHRVGSLRLIGEQRIPLNYRFMDTVVGGLSGIDYDAATDTWLAESDDRSEVSPARFYTLRLRYDLDGFHRAELTGVTFFRQADGSTYPDVAAFARRGGDVPDIEAIRVDPRDGSVWYSSEGNRRLGLAPFVRQARRDGTLLQHFAVGKMFAIDTRGERGPRDNLSFEGLSFSPDGRYLWLGMEAPLYQDGPVTTVQAGAMSRITKYERDGTMVAQYAYPLDPIPVAPGGLYADNGLSEILTVDEQRLLGIERAGVQDKQGVFHFHIRLYEMDVGDATDIRRIDALVGSNFKPVAKRLLLNLDQSGLAQVDNLEGIAWGPKLANGHDSLVLVSDNNFNATQVTQLLVFEVLPP